MGRLMFRAAVLFRCFFVLTVSLAAIVPAAAQEDDAGGENTAAQESAAGEDTEDAAGDNSGGETAGETEARQRITVVGEYLPTDPRSVSSQVSVITEEEIQASAPDNAAEIVASVTGVQVNKYGGATEPSMVSIRGSSPEQVLILINGKRLNTAQGGGVDLSSINPDDIERIEVVRGGSSAVYGENAFGGVINIITKDGYGKEFQTALEYGFSSYYTHEVDGQILGPIGADKQADYFVGLHGLSTRGGYTYSDPHQDDGDAVRENTDGLMGDASVKLGWTVHEAAGIRFAVSGQFHGSKKGVPGLAEFPTPEAEMEDIRVMGLLTMQYRNNPVASATIDVHTVKQIRHYTDPGYFLGEVDDTHDNTALGVNLELSRKDDFRFLFLESLGGYNFRYDHLFTTGLVTSGGTGESGTIDRTAHAVFFREEIHLFPYRETGVGRFQLMPAVRYDANSLRYPDNDYSQASDDFSFTVGALVSFDKRKRAVLKGNIGTTFRAPSFDDLFWPSTAFAAGNPDLEPEEAVVYDAGLLLQPFDFLTLEGVYYRHDVTNLIQWYPGPSGQWRPVNVGKALIQGAEAEAKLLFSLGAVNSYLEIAGNYTFLYAVDAAEGSVTSGKQLPRRARHRANGSITFKHEDGHSVYFGGSYVGKRYQTASNTKYLPAYFVLNTTGRARLGEYVTVSLIIKNLLNQEYIDIREYPIPGREIGCSVKLNIQ
jgi:outer membrane cobalamin receptor